MIKVTWMQVIIFGFISGIAQAFVEALLHALGAH